MAKKPPMTLPVRGRSAVADLQNGGGHLGGGQAVAHLGQAPEGHVVDKENVQVGRTLGLTAALDGGQAAGGEAGHKALA